MWSVLPLLMPWRGDLRRNPQPYYTGRNMSLTEYEVALYVKRELERRGVGCYVHLLDVEGL